MCNHQPPCPAVAEPDQDAAHAVSAHSEQGWSLLCNGVLLFEDGGDGGELFDAQIVTPVAKVPAVAA
ncbi:DUF5999 family protein [Streptomyces goshikiensis]